MNNLKKFYKGKRVFITGHTGFKGTWLSSTLIEFGSNIMGYSLKIIEKAFIIKLLFMIKFQMFMQIYLIINILKKKNFKI